MNVRFGSIVIPALLVLFTGALYLPRLQDAPVYLTPDEVFSALTTHSVASTGRDLHGRFMPLYFQLPKSFVTRMWYQPILMYAMTVSVKMLPFSERAIRLPMALAAVVDVLLMYGVGRLLFRSEALAIGAAVLLALTPAHFINTRVAMDLYASLPFILGWLLCLLMYLERNKPFLVFAAGMFLGVGLYTYIAAYVLMPMYAVMTALVQYRRREPLNRYGALAAGFLLPALFAAPFLLTHPTVVRDTLWRYERTQSQAAGVFALVRALLSYERFAEAATQYWTFWHPRLLFINGPRSMWVAGVFLLPVAGLLVAGVLRTVRRPDTLTLLLVAGLLTAPIPATVVGEPEAIRRAAAVLPFAVLLAIAGLQYVWTAESAGARRIVFVAMCGTVVGLAVTYHDDLLHGQAMVRASTVPLAVAGLAVLLNGLAFDRARVAHIAAVAAIVLVSTHVAYFVANRATIVGVLLLAAISLATLLRRTPDLLREGPLAGIATLALVTAHFMYVYVDYGQLHRVGIIPASIVVLAMRLTFASLALAAVIAVAMLMTGRRTDTLTDRKLVAVASAWFVLTQFAYFSVDYFTDYRLRFIHVTIALAAVVGLAMLVRGAMNEAGRLTLGHIALAAVFGIASIQFASFYVDYFTGFRVRGSADAEGNARVAFEAVIERTFDRSVPAIYLGKIGPYALGDLYWQFYLIKHHREDLLSRTIPDLGFNPDRIRTLPAGSIVITSPSRDIDRKIDELIKDAVLKTRELLKAPDGSPIFWILETGPGQPAF